MAYVIVTELCIINMIANCFFLLKEQIKNFICVNLCNMFCVCHMMPKSGFRVLLSNIRKKYKIILKYFFFLLKEQIQKNHLICVNSDASRL